MPVEIMQANECLTCGDCQTINPGALQVGEGVWCKNVMLLSREITLPIAGAMRAFYLEQKVPFELLIIRVDDVV
ncbi:MAG: hypothetical protein GX030_05650 [Firmicutes bacterium]|nr:hypothetical protein [Bacillota bacterium]